MKSLSDQLQRELPQGKEIEPTVAYHFQAVNLENALAAIENKWISLRLDRRRTFS